MAARSVCQTLSSLQRLAAETVGVCSLDGLAAVVSAGSSSAGRGDSQMAGSFVSRWFHASIPAIGLAGMGPGAGTGACSGECRLVAH